MLFLKQKMLYDICAPKLYTNCFIGNVTYLMSSLQIRNAMMAKIERLQIYSGYYYDEPPYVDLLRGRPWSQLITPPSKTRLSNGATDGSLSEEVGLCLRTVRLLEAILQRDPSAFARLRTVSMGDIPNITWSSSLAPKVEVGMLGASPMSGLQTKSLARTLINMPNVAHACQATQFGPLGLSHGANRIKNPPAVFTYHPKLSSPPCPCTDALGPLILGTMNRHYYTCLYAVKDESVIVASVIDNIVGSVCSTPISDAGEDIGDTDDSDDLGDTMVELYDYVRVSESTQNSRTNPITTPRGHSVRACRPARSLDRLQEIVDEHLPPKWRGRVIFKNREEAPRCTACGLNWRRCGEIISRKRE